MLILTQELLEQIYRHGEQAFPHECCGLLLGRAQGRTRTVVQVLPARNLNPAQDRYRLDPADRLRADEHARRQGLLIVGFYHSHPDHECYFSPTDLEQSEEYQWRRPWVPSAYSYLVASVKGGRAVDRKSFIVQEGRAVEEALEVRGREGPD